MPRTQFRDISGPSAIQPVAQPVNTYVRPADPAPSPLHDLAEGLAQFDRGLQGFMAKRQEKQTDADKIRAEAAFNQNNAMGWAEAVRSGKVPANASPTFMRSYKAAQGNLAGVQLREKFNSAYLTWEGRNSNDPAAFQQFLGDFIKNNVQTDDVDVLRGLNPHIERLWADGHGVFSQESSKSVYDGSVATRAGIVSKTVDAASEQGVLSGKGTNYDALWSDMMEQRKEALASGIRKEDYDKELVATIAAKAVEHQDPYLLDLLDKVAEGDEVALKDFPDFRTMRDDAIGKLSGIARQQFADEEKKQAKADKKREEEITAGAVRVLAQDPTQEIPEDILKEWEKYDPLARKKVAEIRKTLADDDNFESPDEILRIQRDIADGVVGRSDVLKMIEEGKIKNPSTFTSLMDRIEKVQKNKRDGTGILTLQTTKRYSRVISERLKPKGVSADLLGNYALTSEGLEATNDFETMLMEWDDKNPEATQFDREKFIREAGEMVLGRINPDIIDKSSAEAYKSDAQIAQEKFRETTANTPVPSQTDPALSETQNLYGGDKPPMMDRLSDEQINIIEERAAALGMTPEEFNAEVWKKIKQKTGITNPAPTVQPLEPIATTTDQLNQSIQQPPLVNGDNSGPMITDPGVDPTTTDSISQAGDAIGQMIDSVIQNQGLDSNPDPQASSVGPVGSILNLLGKSEATDRGRGYDETLGYGAYTGGPVDLTKMTVGEVKQLQRKMLQHPDNKWNSSAVGRYQIVGKTLRALQQQMGFGDDQVFDAAFQDKLAVKLLEGRGLSSWMNGSMSDGEFLNNVAKEWASIPTTSGSGYYDNQKRTPVTPSDVLSAFTQVKQGGPTPFDSILTQQPEVPSVVPAAYAKIPKAEVQQFLQWNPDPVANHEKNLQSIKPQLADVVRKAQTDSGLKFVVGSGLRDEAIQKKAMEWGWTKTMESNHLHGDAVDIWPLDENGVVDFNPQRQQAIAAAMKKAAKELGVNVGWGGDWKKFKDLPHFELKS